MKKRTNVAGLYTFILVGFCLVTVYSEETAFEREIANYIRQRAYLRHVREKRSFGSFMTESGVNRLVEDDLTPISLSDITSSLSEASTDTTSGSSTDSASGSSTDSASGSTSQTSKSSGTSTTKSGTGSSGSSSIRTKIKEKKIITQRSLK